jgi:hypothetical protein
MINYDSETLSLHLKFVDLKIRPQSCATELILMPIRREGNDIKGRRADGRSGRQTQPL